MWGIRTHEGRRVRVLGVCGGGGAGLVGMTKRRPGSGSKPELSTHEVLNSGQLR